MSILLICDLQIIIIKKLVKSYVESSAILHEKKIHEYITYIKKKKLKSIPTACTILMLLKFFIKNFISI